MTDEDIEKLLKDDKIKSKIVENLLEDDIFINKLARKLFTQPVKDIGLCAPGNIIEFFQNDRFKNIRHSGEGQY